VTKIMPILLVVARVAKAIAAAAAGATAVLATAPQPFSQLTYIQAGVAAIVAGVTIYAIPNAAPAVGAPKA
jgi:hypothetical protein